MVEAESGPIGMSWPLGSGSSSVLETPGDCPCADLLVPKVMDITETNILTYLFVIIFIYSCKQFSHYSVVSHYSLM